MSFNMKRRDFFAVASMASLLLFLSRVAFPSRAVRVVSYMKFENPDIMYKSEFWTPEQLKRQQHYLSVFTDMGYILQRTEKIDESQGIIIVETIWKNRPAYDLFQSLLGKESDRRVRTFAGLHFTETVHPHKAS